MKNFCFALCIAMFVLVNRAFGSEAGMPQLNPEFWAAQIFWLLLTFTSLYLIIWKIFLPKITYNIETRKSKVVNDLHQAQKLKEDAEKKLVEYNKIINATTRPNNPVASAKANPNSKLGNCFCAAEGFLIAPER